MIARRRMMATLAAALATGRAGAQGFAGLATDAEGFALPAPDPTFRFPSDHGAHPRFRIEWWYVTATLTDAAGTRRGAQWTLFRSALRPSAADGWSSPQVWFAHAAVTDADTHQSAETYARGGIGQAGVATAPFSAWINDWSMTGRAGGDADALDRLRLAAAGDGFGYRLDLDAGGAPLLFHGNGGYSVKSAEGHASYYYSQPHYRVQGTLDLPGGPVPVTGRAWLDREWSSQVLGPTQSGWDWMALHLDSGAKLMIGRVRAGDGADFLFGTYLGPDGAARYLATKEIELTTRRRTRVAGRDIPTTWAVRVPAVGVDAEVAALNPASWMETSIAYWEGPVTATGSHTGEGYLEMTGYE